MSMFCLAVLRRYHGLASLPTPKLGKKSEMQGGAKVRAADEELRDSQPCLYYALLKTNRR